MKMNNVNLFTSLIMAGLAWSFVGGANLLFHNRGVGIRLLSTVLPLLFAIGAAIAIDMPGVATMTLQMLGLGAIWLFLLSRQGFISTVAAILHFTNQPVIRFGLVTLTGLIASIGSIIGLQSLEERATLSAGSELGMLETPCRVDDCLDAEAFTDCGTVIVLKKAPSIQDTTARDTYETQLLVNHRLQSQVIRLGPGGDHTNCHGWVFTGGKFRLGPNEVNLILTENGYREIHAPQPGDVVIYRKSGIITHSAVVRYVTAGQPILVEGKWGGLGVMLHPTDKSLYGTDYRFYRSVRLGHLLTGVVSQPPGTETPPTSTAE